MIDIYLAVTIGLVASLIFYCIGVYRGASLIRQNKIDERLHAQYIRGINEGVKIGRSFAEQIRKEKTNATNK